MPASTLRDWVQRQQHTDQDPQLVYFFDSPAGIALLQRLLVAALLVMNLQGNCGLRLVGQFFELSGLSTFLASSYGSLQQHSSVLHTLVEEFGVQQCHSLGKTMPHKRIVVCEDETWPASGMTLVAIEPVSGFLLAEQTADDRTADTWNALLNDRIAPYNVTVIAQCSDEATALRAHADDMGLPHCPDLFHVLHDINSALVPHLARLLRHADDAVVLEQVRGWQKARERAVKSISENYHPYALKNGRSQDMGAVLRLLDRSLWELEAVASKSLLASKSIERLEKARRAVPAMVVSIARHQEQVQEALSAAQWPLEVRSYVSSVALPVAYLRRVAARAGTTAERRDILEVAERLLQTQVAAVEAFSRHDRRAQRGMPLLAMRCSSRHGSERAKRSGGSERSSVCRSSLRRG